MAKLSQLLMLESMLNTYDNMNIKDAWIIEKQGESVEEMVDVIIAKLNRLLDSKTRLSCRNVLVVNFETMKETKYWVKSKLFADLPKDLSKVLRDKIDQMVDLLRALIVKIIDVEADFADRFFDKLKNLYLKKKKRITDYEVWKSDQSHLTIERITGFQAEITTRMLIMGILKYDDDPDEEEVDGVDLERLRKKLKKNRPLPENFDKECAKLRRYSHWEGDMFMIDYDKLRKYLFCAFGKLTCDQHIEMYEYDIQMKQIHEDIKRLKENQWGPVHDSGDAGNQAPLDSEELFRFVHPSLSGEREREIHEEVKRLVKRQGIQDICRYLQRLEAKDVIYLPLMPSLAYAELVRLGMSDKEGYSLANFTKYYKRNLS